MGSATVNLTKQQDQAIHTRGASVAVSAGAGCGKTFVLTERFLANLDPKKAAQQKPNDLRELVAITFTERAAREMRDRVRKKTLERLQHATGDDEINWWWKLLRELDGARISTIHSFCGTLLRTHAVEAKLDPNFALLDESQTATILSELTDDLLRKWLGEQRPMLIDLIMQFGLSSLRNMLHALRNDGGPADWDKWREQTVDEQLDVWQRFHQQQFVPHVLGQLKGSQESRDVIETLRQNEPKHTVMKQRRATLLTLLPHLEQSRQPAVDVAMIRETAGVKGGGTKKDWPSEAAYERFKDAASDLRKRIDKHAPQLSFDRELARPSVIAGQHLFAMAEEIRNEYTRRKLELNLLDFDDMIGRAHRLLTAPEHGKLRKRISSQIALLLVDEFQDTDPVQVDLVRALCGDNVTDGKLFFVGDRKQSIYRFRGAKPRVFHELREELKPAGRLPLTLNFRSQPGVLEFVNALFVERFAPDYEKLEPSKVQISPPPTIEFWWSVPTFGSRDKEVANPTEVARRHEADQIARKLRKMFDDAQPLLPADAAHGKNTLGGKSSALRPVGYGDVAILFRALPDVQYYEQALQEQEIPYYLVGGHAFYAQQEIFDIVNLLRAIDCIADEVSLAGVLRSPIFSCDDETLFWLAQHPGGLAAAICDGPPRKTPPLPLGEGRGEGYSFRHFTHAQRQRVAFAAKTLGELRAMKDRVPIAELLQTALAKTGYDAVLLAEFLGERKLANLRKLIEQARSFDRSSVFTLSDFIVQLSEFVVEQPRESLAATHPETANVVRLMTIHQAKGLEFPVVVVPDIDRPKRSQSATAVFDPTLGPLVKVALEDEKKTTAVGLEMFRSMEQTDDDEESDRLFYVATTRAADRLILSSNLWAMDKPASRWAKLLAERFDLTSGHCIATLPTDYPAPVAEVTMQSVDKTPPTITRRSKTDWEQLADQAQLIAEQKLGILPPHVGPIAPQRNSRRQYSFSRLSGLLQGGVEEKYHGQEKKPARRSGIDDLPEPSIDPLGLGTLVHEVLAEMNFVSREDVAGLVARHSALHLKNDPATMAEAVRMIEGFAQSDRAKQIAAAEKRHSELEFLLAWPSDAPVENGPFLQGFLDCLYRDSAGEWHLLDYKTNNVTAENYEAEAANYERQLGVYALAIETILKTPPRTLTLYFLRPGLEYNFIWNETARRETMDWVNDAIGLSS